MKKIWYNDIIPLYYPWSDYLRKRTFIGNIASEGDMENETPSSQRIVEVLLDETIWEQDNTYQSYIRPH